MSNDSNFDNNDNNFGNSNSFEVFLRVNMKLTTILKTISFSPDCIIGKTK